MSKVYDNWERLVEATLKREKLRQIVLAPSFSSSSSNDFSEINPFLSDMRGDLERTTLLENEIIKTADTAAVFKQKCMELKSKTQELARLLRRAMDLRIDLYKHPLRRVIRKTNCVLYKALTLVLKCSGLVKRVFYNTSAEGNWIARTKPGQRQRHNRCWGPQHCCASLFFWRKGPKKLGTIAMPLMEITTVAEEDYDLRASEEYLDLSE